MKRRVRILCTLAIAAPAIFTIQTTPVLSRPQQPNSEGENIEKLLNGSDCRSCHAVDRKVVGPSYGDVAKKYADQKDAAEKLLRAIREGGTGNWGALRMPPHPDLTDAQLAELIQWILSFKNVAPAESSQGASTREYKYNLPDGKTATLEFPIFVEGNRPMVTKDVFHGYQMYNSYCYRCHGTDATTSELAPDLRRFTESGTLQDFLAVVMMGREDKGMPGWAGFLTEEDVRHVYRYVKGRGLGLVPPGRPPSEFDSQK
jgi:cytochrome c